MINILLILYTGFCCNVQAANVSKSFNIKFNLKIYRIIYMLLIRKNKDMMRGFTELTNYDNSGSSYKNESIRFYY